MHCHRNPCHRNPPVIPRMGVPGIPAGVGRRHVKEASRTSRQRPASGATAPKPWEDSNLRPTASLGRRSIQLSYTGTTHEISAAKHVGSRGHAFRVGPSLLRRSIESRLAPTIGSTVAAGARQLRQHFLYFLPLPHGQGSLRPILLEPKSE